MEMKEEKKEISVSKSKQKRQAQKVKNEKAKRAKSIEKLITCIVIVAVVAVIAGVVGVKVADRLSWVKPVSTSAEFSNMVADDGFVAGIKASDYVTIPDINAVDVPYSEIEYTEENIEANINSQLESHKTLSEDKDKKVENGDTVNIDYAGTINGEAFEGGTSSGFDLTIGSGSFISGFEDQLVGAKAGENVTVKVTFPEDYQSADLAGKDAEFDVAINGIYELPVFDDAFVKENLSEFADTAEGYKEYLKTANEKASLDSFIENYINENTVANKYDNAYTKQLQKVQRFNDETEYEYMNMYYSMYTGTEKYKSFAEYIGEDESSYAKTLKEKAKELETKNFAYQAILEQEGEKVTEDEFRAYLTEQGEDKYDTYVSEFGTGYTLQQYVKIKAIDIVASKANIIK